MSRQKLDNINLGDLVRDINSDFRGIAVARHVYQSGCHRITVQPKVRKDGSLPQSETFDELQLRVIKPGKTITYAVNQSNGGPMPYVDRGR